MVSVLLTRPRASSESLARELKRHGYESVVEPVLIIEPLETPRPDVSGVQATMLTSSNALEAGQDLAAFFDLPCFCVGPHTATKARAAGFRNIRSAASDGMELAQLIESALPGGNATILHISGRDIDSKAQDQLARFGHRVTTWPVYAAKPVLEMTERTVSLLQQGKLDAALVFSVRTAETLVTLLDRNGLKACCGGLTAIGLSGAVTEALKRLPWRKLAAASAPTEDAVIECLKQIHPVS